MSASFPRRWRYVGFILFSLGICCLLAPSLLDLHPVGLTLDVIPRERIIIRPSSASSCSQHVHPTTITLRNELWQVLERKEDHTEIAVFGAYLDEREAVSAHGVVRVFTVASVSDSVEVLCQLWYYSSGVEEEEEEEGRKDDDNGNEDKEENSHLKEESKQENNNNNNNNINNVEEKTNDAFSKLADPVHVVASFENVGRGLKVKTTKYQERLYTCPIPNSSRSPVNVSLTFKQCQQSTTLLTIVRPERKLAHEFGVCVAVSYGKLDPRKLVEWIELNQILGVGEFNLYDSHLHSTTRQVLDYYAAEGLVNVRPSAPAVESWCHWCQKLSVIPAFNDCLYRNMYRYNYTLVIDVDEFIIPHQTHNLKQFMAWMSRDRTAPFPALMFRNAYFFSELQEPQTIDSGDKSYLTTLKYRTRMKPSAQGYAPKSMINPRQCVLVQNHYCAIRTPEVGKYWAETVAPAVALNHHYKNCHYGKVECEKIQQHEEHIADDTTLKYAEELRHAVAERINIMEEKGVIKRK